MSNLVIHAMLLIGLILETVVVKAESEFSFLVGICDDQQRLFCIAALIENNWLITTNECRVTSYDLTINKLVYGGQRALDCIHGESRVFRNIKKLGSNLFGRPSTLILVELSKPFVKSRELTTIKVDASKPADGTTCNVYRHRNITDPFEFVQNLALDRQYKRSDTAYEIEVDSGRIVPCSFLEDHSLICIELKTEHNYRNSPLVCNGRLVGVVLFMHEGDLLAAKYLGSYSANFKKIIHNFKLNVRGCSHKWRSSSDYILFMIFAFLNSCYNVVH